MVVAAPPERRAARLRLLGIAHHTRLSFTLRVCKKPGAEGLNCSRDHVLIVEIELSGPGAIS